MKIVFISNYYNHHQAPFSTYVSKMRGIEYHFIATTPVNAARLTAGYSDMNNTESYIVRAYESCDEKYKAIRLIEESDVVIYGSAPDSYIISRLKQGKLTFKYSERLFKSGLNWKIFVRRFLGSLIHVRRFQNRNLYFLCASAYTAADVNTFANFKGRCFKWGYFTKVDMDFKLEAPKPGASSSEITPLMWCARFLSWKHPELPVMLARRLKDKGYKFVLNMYGSGVELERTQKLARELNVCDVVNFCGVLPNDQILEQMKKHEVFLFTSDFNEGWGAVLNESMSCGCVPVASHAIGSVPFLINDGVNGLIYENENLDSLTEKVELLLTHPYDRFAMRLQVVKTMQNQWNAKNAAKRFVELVQKIINGNKHPDLFNDGVCSQAEILKNDWFRK